MDTAPLVHAEYSVEGVLRLDDKLFRAIIESASDGVMVTAPTMNAPGPAIVYVNDALCTISGYSPEELLEQSPRLLQSPNTDRRKLDSIRSALASNATIRTELLNQSKSGHEYWVDLVIMPIFLEKDTPQYFASIQRDITHQKLYQDGLEYLAEIDELTGISNRRGYELILRSEWEHAKRNQQPIALLLVDLDNFKAINDTAGHQVGDALLKRVATLISDNIRDNDFVARLGGDELVVILRGCALDRAVGIAEKVRRAIAEDTMPAHPPITASMGIAVRNHHYGELSHFIADADRAVYQAKRRGRNRIATIGEDNLDA